MGDRARPGGEEHRGLGARQRLQEVIARIDARLSAQLGAVMQAPRFLQLEGSWRGLHHLVTGCAPASGVKIRLLNLTKRQLFDDLARDIEFDRRRLYQRVCVDAFAVPEGEPCGVLIGDYAFTNHRDDFRLLQEMAGVAAVAGAPFVSAASPALFDLADFRGLAEVADLSRIFAHPKYTRWRGLRDSEDSRFVCLTLPRVLVRGPYGKGQGRGDSFDVEAGRAPPHEHQCWMSAAYLVGLRCARAFAAQGWWDTLSVTDGDEADVVQAGTVDNESVCRDGAVEIAFNERQVEELGRLGFLPLIQDGPSSLPDVGRACSVHKPRTSDRPEASADAAIAARLPCVLALSRVVHCIRVMESCRKGAYMTVADVEAWLTGWIGKYVGAGESAMPDEQIRYPLCEARVEVGDDGPDSWGHPRGYRVTLHLRPRVDGDVLADPVLRFLRLTWTHR